MSADVLAAALAAADRAEPVRLALVAKDATALAKAVEQARTRLRDKPAPRWSLRSGAFYGSAPETGKLAFLFPGEGSQYTNMLADLALCFDEVRQWLDFWHSLYDQARGDNRTDVLFPHASENDEASRKRLEARLHDMDVGSEAVFVAGMAMQSLLRSLGVEPDVMMGHSSGESAALAASGAVRVRSLRPAHNESCWPAPSPAPPENTRAPTSARYSARDRRRRAIFHLR